MSSRRSRAGIPRVIVNADDFGLSPGVNRGIVKAFRTGVLTSTTTLVNLEHFDDAVELAKQNPDLPLGVHLSLLWGGPVATPERVPSLCGADGKFLPGLGALARRYFLGRLDQGDVAREFRSQIERFVAAGLSPTHVDTHKHVHCLPGVMRGLIEAIRDHGIRRVRFPSSAKLAGGQVGVTPVDRLKARVVRFFVERSRPDLDAAGLTTTDHFVGIEQMRSFDATVLRDLLERLPEGVTEVMCHPGFNDETADRYTRVAIDRERELQALIDPEVVALRDSGRVVFTDYGAL